jgi:hypothetical protein
MRIHDLVISKTALDKKIQENKAELSRELTLEEKLKKAIESSQGKDNATK